MKKEILERVGENVDRLITVDVPGRGEIDELYTIARKAHGRPLTLMAAEKLVDRIEPESYVIIATGLVMPGTLMPEIDGPVGAAALARALAVGKGAKPIFLVNEEYMDMMKMTARGANLNVITQDILKKVGSERRGVSIIPFPVDPKKAEKLAGEIMDEFEPKAVIGVERRGPNQKGVYHSVTGISMSQYEGKIGYLFDEAVERGKLTIGMGDGCGIEIGFGKIIEAAKHVRERYTQCTCPCRAGVADTTDVDVFLVATVSNWAAYGINACMSAILDKPEILHSESIQIRMLRECADQGAIGARWPSPTEDNLPTEISVSLIKMLREIVRSHTLQ